ncbi:MAG: CDP-diacylglycerol--glycerol-3-phosphate 3-phosphatidyltransferase [Candidatus Marinimicrobia bacterium]|nr:CDP-diacylglycerol--glycerol-3-phosphate 3-phosphatidyltransferase [Candidatus Neomarinimicrobiota bacterium]|tara:strand:- start:9387 stop:9953 length:567 start_codon:yes stop_codon:yes gene_type:complete
MIFQNIPNILSVSRILLAPLFFVFLTTDIILYVWLSIFIFFLGSLTDAVDGYIARKYKLESKFGKHLDPIADKVFIITSFFSLMYVMPDYVRIWMLLIIILRDVFVTYLRKISEYRGLDFKTNYFAKRKTLVQVITIHLILLIYILEKYYAFKISLDIVYYLMIVSVSVTFLSGISYWKQYTSLVYEK